jgi:HrpA-like RNA helicase
MLSVGRIQRKRPELRLIVSSATLEAQKLADFFNTNKTTDPSKDTAAILSIEGNPIHCRRNRSALCAQQLMQHAFVVLGEQGDSFPWTSST